MTLRNTCGSGHVQAGDGQPHRVRWTCVNCELEHDFGLVEQPSRCQACGSPDWRSTARRFDVTPVIPAGQRAA